jgi:hypothetical protein
MVLGIPLSTMYTNVPNVERCPSGGHAKGFKSKAELLLSRVCAYLRKEAKGKCVLRCSGETSRIIYQAPRPEFALALQVVNDTLAAVKVCNCTEEMRTGELKKAPAHFVEGAPRPLRSLLAMGATAQSGMDYKQAQRKGYDLNNVFSQTTEGDYEVIAKLARVGQYLRAQEPQPLWIAPSFRAVKYSGPDTPLPNVKWDGVGGILNRAYMSVRFFPVDETGKPLPWTSVNLWMHNCLKKEYAPKPYKNSLNKFIERWASYGDNLIKGQYTKGGDGVGEYKERIPFGSLGESRLGYRQWTATHYERDENGNPVDDCLHRYQVEQQCRVSESIQANPELYRENIRQAREMYTRLHTPVKGDRNDRRSGAAYRTAEPVPAYTFPVNLDCMDYPDAGKVLHKGRYIVHEPLKFARCESSVYTSEREEILRAEILREFKLKTSPEKPDISDSVLYVGLPQKETKEEHIEKYFLQLALSPPSVTDGKVRYKLTPCNEFCATSNTPYKEADTTLSRFLNVGAVEISRNLTLLTKEHNAVSKGAYMYQKSNGAWYITKAYRDADGKPQRKALYIGMDVCRKSDSDVKRKQDALRYCIKKSRSAFKVLDWAEWMRWKSICYALHLAGAKGSEEGGGWSSIYTSSKEGAYTDAMAKQSLLFSLEKNRRIEDAAQRSARKEVYNYNWEDYNEQDKNTALLTVRALVTFTATADGEEESARAQELSTAEDLTREEVKEETNEEVKPKRKRKEDSKAEFLRKAHIQHSGIGTGIQGGHRAVWAPSMETAAKEFTDAHDLKEVLCSVCEQMHTVVVVYKKQITLLCGHTRPVGVSGILW